MRWRSFVAVGDSFTEGLDDPHEDGSGPRGWADLVAVRLAAEHRARAGDRGHTERHAAGGRGVRLVNPDPGGLHTVQPPDPG